MFLIYTLILSPRNYGFLTYVFSITIVTLLLTITKWLQHCHYQDTYMIHRYFYVNVRVVVAGYPIKSSKLIEYGANNTKIVSMKLWFLLK